MVDSGEEWVDGLELWVKSGVTLLFWQQLIAKKNASGCHLL